MVMGNRRKNLMATASVAMALSALAASGANATPLTLTGNYLQVGISDYGTFGSDGSTEPGILSDPSGTGNFYPGGVANDILTPGDPHDGFAISSAQTGFEINDNDGYSAFGTASPTLLTGAAANGYANAATWSGTDSYGVQITTSYFFNVTEDKIIITSTITNDTGAALTDLYFGRSEDPDPDVNLYGDYNTINTLGDSVTPANKLASGAGAQTGLTIGILSTDTVYASNTDISTDCCSNNDPSEVFNGTDPNATYPDYPTTNDGDYGLQIAWQIGTLAAGATTTVNYDYVFGLNEGTVSVGGVPEPSTWAMMLAGFAGLGFLGYRQTAKARLAA
jgi:hypothetical protein